MPKPLPDRKIEIVMSVDRTTGVLDLRVSASHPNKRRTEIVGTVNLRMEDLREVAPMLTERLRIEDQLVKAESAARKSKKVKAKNS
jgi:hypothetical protein